MDTTSEFIWRLQLWCPSIPPSLGSTVAVKTVQCPALSHEKPMSGVEMIARLICFTFGRRAQKQSVVDGGAQVDGRKTKNAPACSSFGAVLRPAAHPSRSTVRLEHPASEVSELSVQYRLFQFHNEVILSGRDGSQPFRMARQFERSWTLQGYLRRRLSFLSCFPHQAFEFVVHFTLRSAV